ncbi:hypothetical protein EV426DRAFT_711468 [Tirmania nivea]|nr:hypothetical protein EV426DRAFT_711468 [Tirmania nivea]
MRLELGFDVIDPPHFNTPLRRIELGTYRGRRGAKGSIKWNTHLGKLLAYKLRDEYASKYVCGTRINVAKQWAIDLRIGHLDPRGIKTKGAIGIMLKKYREARSDLEAKHKAAFPDAIHESDARGGLRVLCYEEEDELTGKQVVQFRAVVADYVTDLAARVVANTVAGGGLTNRQLVRRAMRHVKAKINGGVTYAALGLPETEA